jgi:ribonuclease HII
MVRHAGRRTRQQEAPDLVLELKWLARFEGPVAGVDEAGRGPLAGPVVAAAVILRPDAVPDGIRDSKELSPEQRLDLYDRIRQVADVSVGIADVARIDRDNILQATLWAMRKAIAGLPRKPAMALIDGNRVPKLACAVEPVVRGDQISLSIAAASIIAKVTRDRIMDELAVTYPGYGFERHKGYATPEHRQALGKLGASPIHRRSFAPVRLALAGMSASELQVESTIETS